MSCRCRCRCRCRYMRSHSLTCKAKCQSTHARHHNYYLFFILQNNYLFFAFCVTFLATKRKIFFSVWSKTKEQSCHAMSMYDKKSLIDLQCKMSKLRAHDILTIINFFLSNLLFFGSDNLYNLIRGDASISNFVSCAKRSWLYSHYQ